MPRVQRDIERLPGEPRAEAVLFQKWVGSKLHAKLERLQGRSSTPPRPGVESMRTWAPAAVNGGTPRLGPEPKQSGKRTTRTPISGPRARPGEAPLPSVTRRARRRATAQVSSPRARRVSPVFPMRYVMKDSLLRIEIIVHGPAMMNGHEVEAVSTNGEVVAVKRRKMHKTRGKCKCRVVNIPRFEKLLAKNKLTLMDLSKQLGVHKHVVYQFTKRTGNPARMSRKMAHAVGNLLGASPSTFTVPQTTPHVRHVV